MTVTETNTDGARVGEVTDCKGAQGLNKLWKYSVLYCQNSCKILTFILSQILE